MRIRLSIADIRDMAASAIAPGIEIHRGSRTNADPGYVAPSGEPTEEEIDEFVETNQLLDSDTIADLLFPGPMGYAGRMDSIRAEELQELREYFDSWAETNTWLAADGVSVIAIAAPQPSTSRIWSPKLVATPPAWLNTSSAAQLATELIRTGRPLSDLDWRSFERLLAELLEDAGWSVELTRGSRDGGVDVIGVRVDPLIGRVKSLWQAKKYSDDKKVGLATVREMVGILDLHRATKGMIVTTSSLTKGALDLVRQDEYRLGFKDGPLIRQWIDEYLADAAT